MFQSRLSIFRMKKGRQIDFIPFLKPFGRSHPAVIIKFAFYLRSAYVRHIKGGRFFLPKKHLSVENTSGVSFSCSICPALFAYPAVLQILPRYKGVLLLVTSRIHQSKSTNNNVLAKLRLCTNGSYT